MTAGHPIPVAPEPTGFRDVPDNQDTELAGALDHVVHQLSRQGNPYATAVLRCPDGAVAVQVPPRAHTEYGALIVEEAAVRLAGKVDRRGDSPHLTVTGVVPAAAVAS